MMKEIPDHDGYFVTEEGKIYSNLGKGCRRDTNNSTAIEPYEITPRVARNGYLRIYARNTSTNKREDLYIHRVVAEAFIPNPQNLKCINHKDTDRSNNNVNNLEWCTYKYNNNYTMQLGHMIRDAKGRFQSGIKE